ncbi:hypothetical protein K2X30_13890 [bacterium]|jgi:hypothetical protein|nr:hypothetical protein [bacterium]
MKGLALLLLSTSTYLLGAPAHAGTPCKNPDPATFQSVTADGEAGCEAAKEFSRAIAEVRKFTPRPSPFELTIHHEEVLYQQEDRFSTYGAIEIKDPKLRINAGWMHEYGHSVCSKILEQNIPEYKRYAETQRRAETFARETVTQAKSITDPRKKLAYISSRSAKLKTFETDPKFKRTIEPYHELCADVVSVLHAQDASAMTKTLAKTVPSELHPRIRPELYDFSKPHPNTETDACYGDPHHVFAPVRSQLGSMGIARQETAADKTRFFNQFAITMVTQLRQQLKTPNCDSVNKNYLFMKAMNPVGETIDGSDEVQAAPAD